MSIKKTLTLVLCSSLITAGFIATPAHARDISFAWTANQEQIDGYKLYYDTDTSGAPYQGTGAQEGGSPVTITSGQSTQTTLHGLSDTATYHFSLTAFTSNEESGYSSEITVQSESSNNGEITAHFAWTPNTESELNGYKIHYGTTHGTYTEVADIGNPTIGADNKVHGEVAQLTEGTTYYFVCTAYNTQGNESDYSREIEWTATGQSTANPPVADNGSLSTDENQTVTGSVTASNDSGLSITYQVEQNVSHGSLNLTAATGDFSYTPATNFSGTDSFTFSAHDNNGTSDPATITITITEVNSPPQADSISITVAGDASYSGKLHGSDPDGDALTFSRLSTPTKGSVSVDGSGNFTYTPNSNQTGTDSFTFKVNDGRLDSSPAIVSITLTTVNHPPTVTSGSIATPANTSVSGQLQANDPDGDTLTYTIVGNGSRGTASITNAQTGAFTYTPNQDATGTDSFTFRVNDGTVNSGNGTISVTITQVNHPPTAQPTSFTGGPNTTISGRLNGSDPDGDSLTFSVVSQPGKGGLTLNPSGTFTYTPNQNASGSDTFTFKVNDGSIDSSPATATIILSNVEKSAQFKWTANQEQVEGYRLYYKTGTEGGPEYNGTGANEGDSPIDVGNVTSFNLTGLEANKQYYFTITAYFGAEESEYSKEIVLWTGDTPAAPVIIHISAVK